MLFQLLCFLFFFFFSSRRRHTRYIGDWSSDVCSSDLESDIATINAQMTDGATKPKPKISFDEGENVRVIDGPFANFAGIVEEVKAEKRSEERRVGKECRCRWWR